MTPEQKKALLNALEILIDAGLVDLGWLHLGLKNLCDPKNLRSEKQNPDDQDSPKRNE